MFVFLLTFYYIIMGDNGNSDKHTNTQTHYRITFVCLCFCKKKFARVVKVTRANIWICVKKHKVKKWSSLKKRFSFVCLCFARICVVNLSPSYSDVLLINSYCTGFETAVKEKNRCRNTFYY